MSKKQAIRCKPGDIAMVIRTGNAGALVTIEQAYDGEILDGVLWNGGPNMWVIKTIGHAMLGAVISDKTAKTHYSRCAMPDAWLCPIRDTKGVDQMLRITPKGVSAY